MILIARLRSLIETILGLLGLALRIAVAAFGAAVILRIGGLVQPEMLPGFWMVVAVGTIVLLPAGYAMGRQDVAREDRDRAIRAAEERYRGRV